MSAALIPSRLNQACKRAQAQARVPAMRLSLDRPASLFQPLVPLLAALLVLGVPSGADAAVTRRHDPRATLDLFVMSRCPDAVRCEARLNEVLQQVGNLTQVRLNFIADVHEDLVTCKHGDLECAGNSQQLCVQRTASGSQTWDFVQCLNSNASDVGQEACADRCLASVMAEGRDFDDIQSCYYGKEGTALLYGSAQRTRSLGVKTSCTIWLEGKPRCVHDGGVWYDCPGGPEAIDFANSICNAFWDKTGFWPAECKRLREAPGGGFSTRP